MRAQWMIALIAMTALAGCFGDDSSSDPVPTCQTNCDEAQGNVTQDANVTVNETVTPATPPVLDANVSALEGTVPWTLTVSINGTASGDGNLTWNATLDGVLAGNGSELPASLELLIDVAGAHTLTVTLTEGNLTNSTTFDLVAFDGAAPVVSYDDADTDATTDMTEILDLEATLAGADFVLTAHVGDIPTGFDGLGASPWGYHLELNGHDFDCFNYVGVDTFSGTEGAYIGGCSWDAATDTVRMVIKESNLKAVGATAPYVFSFGSYIGVVTFYEELDDQAPDSGTLTLG